MSQAEEIETNVARPLHILAVLIRDDLRNGNEAAARASEPYYRAAGEKLVEAKAQLQHGEFTDWVRRNFKISERHARRYMALARTAEGIETGRGRPFSLSEAIGERRSPPPPPPKPKPKLKPTLKPTLKPRWSDHAFQEELKQRRANFVKEAAEHSAQRLLALEMIDLGFKALANKLHPDKGGSPEAMARLNIVRERHRKLAGA